MVVRSGPLQHAERPDGTCEKFSCWHKSFLASVVLLLAFFLAGFVIYDNYNEVSRWEIPNVIGKQLSIPAKSPASNYVETAIPSPMHRPNPVPMQSLDKHGELCPHGSGALPKGLVQGSSDLEMRSLWGNPIKEIMNYSAITFMTGTKGNPTQLACNSGRNKTEGQCQ